MLKNNNRSNSKNLATLKKVYSQFALNYKNQKANKVLDYEHRQANFSPKLYIMPRSTDLKFNRLEKQMDFDKVVTSQNKVHLYQSYTNRCKTPKRIYRNNKTRENASQNDQFALTCDSVRSLFQNDIFVSPKTKEIILEQLQPSKLPPLPKSSCSPRIKSFKSTISKCIINDYHSMETNRSYGRNHIGGFFFH